VLERRRIVGGLKVDALMNMTLRIKWVCAILTHWPLLGSNYGTLAGGRNIKR
jgi:hypothetical protein